MRGNIHIGYFFTSFSRTDAETTFNFSVLILRYLNLQVHLPLPSVGSPSSGSSDWYDFSSDEKKSSGITTYSNGKIGEVILILISTVSPMGQLFRPQHSWKHIHLYQIYKPIIVSNVSLHCIWHTCRIMNKIQVFRWIPLWELNYIRKLTGSQ